MSFGRKVLTEKQIAEDLPGYTEAADGNGYSYDGEVGRITVTGALPGDQLFEKEGLGVINVSRALEYYESHQLPVQTVEIEEGLKRNISLIEINAEYVRKLPAVKLREPVLLTVSDDGVQVLDGHHRLSRLILAGKKSYPAVIMPPEGIGLFQVRAWEQGSDGQLRLFSGADERYIAEKVARAKRRWNNKSYMR